mmetsp:Transcript_10261/g.13764  ORF Transcript_10261/g.13764 Transcript_10261/m.13764 type:complete len:195 (+) Transcript_10261:104-688(+)
MAAMFPGMAGLGGGGAGGPPPEPADDGKMIDLSEKISKSETYARNEASNFPHTNLFIGDSRLGCKSDADEQLIVHIAFNEPVKLHSFKLTEFNTGADPELNPTKILVFVNKVNIGFEDVEDIDPTQTFHLTEADLKEGSDPIRTQYVKFQRVRSITLFVEDNAGGDISAIGGLKLYGRTVATMNMNDFKKQSQE